MWEIALLTVVAQCRNNGTTFHVSHKQLYLYILRYMYTYFRNINIYYVQSPLSEDRDRLRLFEKTSDRNPREKDYHSL